MSTGLMMRAPRPAMTSGGRPSIGEQGLTLIELMISLALGLLIVLAATATFLSTKSAYTAGDDATRIEDAGRHALEIISRAVRQAAYVDWRHSEAPVVVEPGMSPSIAGMDARALNSTTAGTVSPQAQSINGSDFLSVQFFGAADETMLNCAGFPIAAGQRGASIFYVASDASGEPQVYCKYFGDAAWTAAAIARGVESFQVLYGVDTDDDGMPNRMLSAAAINALDDATVGGAESAVRNAKTFWKKVVTVNVALLVRGEANTGAGGSDASITFDLFGKEYADKHAADDPGVRVRKEDLPASVRDRYRKVYSTTIQLRNAVDGAN